MPPGDEKTEPATPRRREKAREQGDVAVSREIPTVMVLGSALVVALSGLGAGLLETVVRQSRSVWSGSEIHPTTLSDFHALLWQHAAMTGVALLPIAVLLMVAGGAAYVAQIGPLWSPKALGFRLSRINLLSGLKRLVNVEKLVELVKAAIKIGLLGTAAWLTLRADLVGVFSLANAEIFQSLAKGGELSLRLVIAAMMILIILSIIDIAWVRHRFEKKLRMSKQEVRDERKQREGDPTVKGRLRQMQRDLTRQRMIAEVSEADVVVTNPTHFAVALRYEQGEMGAPKVIAKGRGYVALRIREIAREHGVPIVENPPLAQVLYRTVSVGREIPENLFQAVAEILAYVYRLRPASAGAAS